VIASVSCTSLSNRTPLIPSLPVTIGKDLRHLVTPDGRCAPIAGNRFGKPGGLSGMLDGFRALPQARQERVVRVEHGLPCTRGCGQMEAGFRTVREHNSEQYGSAPKS